MVNIFKQSVIALFVFAIGLFAFVPATHAASTIDDPDITSVTVGSISSTTVAATGVTYQVTVVLADTISANGGFYVNARAAGCTQDYLLCTLDFTSATVSGISTTSTSGSGSFLSIQNSDALTAGSYTITISNVKNAGYAGAQRLVVGANANSSLNPTGSVGTDSTPFVIGTPLVVGTITDPDGNPLQTYGQARNDDYSVYGYFNADEWGYYSLPDPGFSAGQTVTVTVFPEASTGLFTTSSTFAASSSTTTLNITAQAAKKTVTGVVKYADDGSVVTSASVNANGGSVWANDNVDDTGTYELKLSGGEYEVCLGDKYDENGKRVAKDWYTNNGENCKHVSFSQDDSTQTETVNFTVYRADAKIVGIFKNPDGTFPAQGGWVSFFTQGLWFGGSVDNTTGSFEVAVVGGNKTAIQSTTLHARAVASTTYEAQYAPHSTTEYTYWDTSTVSVSADETLDLGTITLKEKDVVYTATVVDQNGTPVPDMHVDAWREGGGWANTETDDNGVATVRLYPGVWNIRPSTWDTTEYIYAGEGVKKTYASGDTDSGTFTLQATTVNVSISAITQTGELAAVNGWANCWSQSGGYGFGGQVQYGEGSFGAIGGEYHCNLWAQDQNYQASGESKFTFVDGQDKAIAFTMLERSATVSVSVKDQDSKLIKDSSARVFASSPGSGWIEERLQDGKADIRLAPGSYRIGVWFEGGSTEYISGWNTGTDVTVKENDTKNATISVFGVTATLTATLRDNEGNPVQNAWVGCGNWQELDGQIKGDLKGGQVIESGSQSGSDGVAVVGLVKGHEYECWVGVHSEFSELIGPAAETIDVTKKSTAEATFIFKKATAKIKGALTFAKSTGVSFDDVEAVWCNGYADEGYNTWDDTFDENYTLNVLEGTWHVWCGTEIVGDDGERKWYASNDTTVKVNKEGNFTKDLEMEESLFTIPESFSTTIDATTQTSLTLPDGTKLNIPAGSIASSGNITLTAEPETNIIRSSFDSPFGFPYNFEAYDEDGTLITTFNDSITLEIPYDQEKLDALDIEEADILPKYYDEEKGAWINVDNATLNEDEDVATFTLNHFTQVGLIYNNVLAQSTSEKPKAPKALKAKQITKTGALLTWKKPKSGKVTKYKVQLREFKVKKQKQWQKFTGVKAKKKKMTELSSGTTYQFRVAACNSAGCSKFAKWKSFKTKGKK